jgi:hypothetical protein
MSSAECWQDESNASFLKERGIKDVGVFAVSITALLLQIEK